MYFIFDCFYVFGREDRKIRPKIKSLNVFRARAFLFIYILRLALAKRCTCFREKMYMFWRKDVYVFRKRCTSFGETLERKIFFVECLKKCGEFEKFLVLSPSRPTHCFAAASEGYEK